MCPLQALVEARATAVIGASAEYAVGAPEALASVWGSVDERERRGCAGRVRGASLDYSRDSGMRLPVSA